MDCSFERITEIKPHPNADRLEVAIISNYDVIVGKGEFKVGDVVFYIREDAKLYDYNGLKEWEANKKRIDTLHDKGELDDEAYAKRLESIGSEYKFRYPWQSALINYLGSQGRVKVVRLRGVMSAGIAVKLDKLYGHINKDESKDWEADNARLTSGVNSSSFAEGKFGVSHWVLPERNCGDMSASGTLCWGLPKSDESNWQNLKEYDLPIGEKCIVTQKLDGSSITICCAPDGEVHVTSRSLDLKLDADNNYNRAAKSIIPLGLAWAKKNNKRICLRGELTARNIQQYEFNTSRDIENGLPTFNMYGVYMPDECDTGNKYGRYGTKYHFLKIAEEIKELTGVEIRCVPVIEKDVELTYDLLKKYRDMPYTFGEGVVVGYRNGNGSCKSKSLEYLEKISKHCSK